MKVDTKGLQDHRPERLSERARRAVAGGDLAHRAEELRTALGMPSGGWLHLGEGRRHVADFKRWFPDSGRRELAVERLLGHLGDVDTTTRVLGQVGQLEATGHRTDLQLILAIAYREQGGVIFSPSSRLSPDTMTRGGLDHLFRERHSLDRAGYLPPGFVSRIRPGTLGGSVSINELIIAYGAFVNRAQNEFLKHARALGLDVSGLTPLSMRAWTQIFFAAPHSRNFRDWERAGRRGREFGGFTALTLAQRLITEGRASDLNEALRHPDLIGPSSNPRQGFDIVQRGLLSAAEAEMIGEALGSSRAGFSLR